MKIKVSHKAWLVIGATLALLALWWAADTTLAQGPVGRAPKGGSPINTFTYQGRLTDGGAPANGPYDLRFTVYDSDVAGNQIGGVMDYPDWPVTDGVFSVNLQPAWPMSNVFNGDPRWLLVEVRPGASGGAYTAMPRQPITGVPYAWGLEPGAVISGTATAADAWLLKASLNGTTYPTASAIQGNSATGYAVNGISTSGWGFYGRTDDGFAVAGYDSGSTNARGYGGFFESTNGVGVFGESLATRTWNNNFAPGVYGKSTNGAGVYGFSNNVSGQGGRFVNVENSGDSTQVALWAGTDYGNIIEGHELDTSGTGMSIGRRFRVSRSGYVYADGSYNCGLASSCFNTGIGADVAERVDTIASLQPGDVVEIDLDRPGEFRLSQTSFSALVAGVISTNPAITMNNNDFSDDATRTGTDNRPLLALVGQVPVKVSAENGAIQPGDLLVASSTPGRAMKAGLNPPAGTIIGKALEGLDAGTGVIKMLVMLR